VPFTACTTLNGPSVKLPETNLTYGVKFNVVKSEETAPEKSPRVTESSIEVIVILMKFPI
jgi:hypothetical protein